MFESIINFFKKLGNKNKKESSDTAKERLHLVLMQDRANVSADFLELMKQEIIEVIKKYIDIDEKAIDVKLTNKTNEDGTVGAPALYANIPIVTIKNDARKLTLENKPNEEESAVKAENKDNTNNGTDKEENNKALDKEEQNVKEDLLTKESANNQKADSIENKENGNNNEESLEQTQTNENNNEDENIKKDSKQEENNVEEEQKTNVETQQTEKEEANDEQKLNS